MDVSDRPLPEVPPTGYEFDARQSETISALASAMRWVAISMIVLGVLYGVAAVIQLVKAPLPALLIGLGAALYLALGIWTRQAADSFTSVASTAGRDIHHLMDALDTLRKKYSLLALIVKIYIAILVVALILGVIGLLSAGAGFLGN
jgi:hypothetical protein